VSAVALAGLARGDHAIGLDFEGGAMVMLAPFADDGRCDPQTVDKVMRARHPTVVYRLDASGDRCGLNFPGLTDEPSLDAIERTLLAEHTPQLAVDYRDVIRPIFAPALGLPTALGLGVTATLLWCLALAIPARPLAVAAAPSSALVVGLAWLLELGSTLSRASYLAALWFAPAIAILTATSGRPRLRRGLVGLLVFAGLIIAATAVKSLDVRTVGDLVWVRAAARMAFAHAPLAAGLALLAIWTMRDP
jgi:hypothetical protein